MKRTGYSGWIGVEYVWIDWEHCNESIYVTGETILVDGGFMLNHG